jgi:hypothetical protein
MPSKTKRQANFMKMCASSQARNKVRGNCPPEKVAEEFVKADKGKFKKKKKKK